MGGRQPKKEFSLSLADSDSAANPQLEADQLRSSNLPPPPQVEQLKPKIPTFKAENQTQPPPIPVEQKNNGNAESVPASNKPPTFAFAPDTPPGGKGWFGNAVESGLNSFKSLLNRVKPNEVVSIEIEGGDRQKSQTPSAPFMPEKKEQKTQSQFDLVPPSAMNQITSYQDSSNNSGKPKVSRARPSSVAAMAWAKDPEPAKGAFGGKREITGIRRALNEYEVEKEKVVQSRLRRQAYAAKEGRRKRLISMAIKIAFVVVLGGGGYGVHYAVTHNPKLAAFFSTLKTLKKGGATDRSPAERPVKSRPANN